MKNITHSRVTAVEWVQVESTRPRHAGSNARLGDHGLTIRLPLARITTDDGTTGVGHCRADERITQTILGKSLAELFQLGSGTTKLGQPFDFSIVGSHGETDGCSRLCLGGTLCGQTCSGAIDRALL